MLNSRSLTPLATGPNDLQPLRARHISVGKPLITIPNVDHQIKDLSSITSERSEVSPKIYNQQNGQRPLPLQWPMKRLLEAIEDKDKLVRVLIKNDSG